MTALEQTHTQSPAEMRGKILELEAVMLQMPQVEIPIEHRFAPGLYLREMTVPANVTITGKIHKTEHFCILAKGSVTVVTENGRKEYAAPATIHSLPGDKRALQFHDASVWINVHHNPTDERDLKKIDDIFVCDSYEQLPSFMDEKRAIREGI